MDSRTGLAVAADLFKALGNESRLAIVQFLANGPASVGAIAAELGIPQPLTSQHLRGLRDAGLVIGERRGRFVTYRVSDAHVNRIVSDALVHASESRERIQQ